MEEFAIDFERESDAPDDWQENLILVRDGKGRMIEVVVPDDTEEGEEVVGND